MKLIIFGASGSIGQLVVTQALDAGYKVKAFARNPRVSGCEHENLNYISGDVMDASTVSEAVVGQDAVIIVVGAGLKGGVRAPGTRNIVQAMEMHGVARLVVMSTLGVGDSKTNLNFFWKYVMFGLLLRAAYNDHVKQELLVRQSALDWIIVRPAGFTDGPASGNYHHGFPATEKGLSLNVSRSDVAGFLLQQLTDNTYLHQAPGLSY